MKRLVTLSLGLLLLAAPAFAQAKAKSADKAAAPKAASAAGKVTAVNERVTKEPELVTAEPYAAGWLIEIEMSNDADLAKLKDAAGYRDFIASLPE